MVVLSSSKTGLCNTRGSISVSFSFTLRQRLNQGARRPVYHPPVRAHFDKALSESCSEQDIASSNTCGDVGGIEEKATGSSIGGGSRKWPKRTVRARFDYNSRERTLSCHPSCSDDREARAVASVLSRSGTQILRTIPIYRHNMNMSFTADLISIATLAACVNLAVKHFYKTHIIKGTTNTNTVHQWTVPAVLASAAGLTSILVAVGFEVLAYAASVVAGWWSMTLAMDEVDKKKYEMLKNTRLLKMKGKRQRERFREIVHSSDSKEHSHDKKSTTVTGLQSANGNGTGGTSLDFSSSQHIDPVMLSQHQRLQHKYHQFLKVTKANVVISPVDQLDNTPGSSSIENATKQENDNTTAIQCYVRRTSNNEDAAL